MGDKRYGVVLDLSNNYFWVNVRFIPFCPNLPGYTAGRFCRIAWRTAMTIFRNIAQSNRGHHLPDRIFDNRHLKYI
jgi:hypothetical protein